MVIMSILPSGSITISGLLLSNLTIAVRPLDSLTRIVKTNMGFCSAGVVVAESNKLVCTKGHYSYGHHEY